MIETEGKDVPFIPYFIRTTGISILISDIGYSLLATFDRNPAWMNTDMSHILLSTRPPKVKLGKRVNENDCEAECHQRPGTLR